MKCSIVYLADEKRISGSFQVREIGCYVTEDEVIYVMHVITPHRQAEHVRTQ